MTTAAVTAASLAFLLCSTGASAQSWFDKLKNKAKDAVEDSVDEQIDSVTEDTKKSTPAPVGNPKTEKAAASSSSQNQKSTTAAQPSGNSYGETIGAAANLMKRWPYDNVQGKPVRDIELKGVTLGMPLPLAIEALDAEGYSRVTGLRFQRIMYEYNGRRYTLSQAEYSNLPPNERGNIIRSYVVELEAIAPSEEIAQELPAYPEPEKEKSVQLSADERKRCELMNSRNRTWSRGLSGDEVRALQDKCSRASGDRPTLEQDPQYVSRIWYGQRFISGENVNFEAFKAKAKETYGEPTYAYEPGSSQAAGAAFNRSGLMWWVDSALVPKAKINEMLQKCGNDDRVMVFKDFIHPGKAHNAFYVRAYENSFEDMVEALHIAFAPHLAVGYEKGSYIVDLAWPFLGFEKSYRELWRKREEREAQPEADFEF
jgi:hypothetical protein